MREEGGRHRREEVAQQAEDMEAAIWTLPEGVVLNVTVLSLNLKSLSSEKKLCKPRKIPVAAVVFSSTKSCRPAGGKSPHLVAG